MTGGAELEMADGRTLASPRVSANGAAFWCAAAVVLLAQCAMFWFFIHQRPWQYADASFYELPAWNLVSGHGFTHARAEWEDPFLTTRYQGRHPEADPEWVPAATFAPGYSLFLAALYGVTGRSDEAARLANGGLLLVTVAGLIALAAAAFKQPLERFTALALAGVFPFWAFWSASLVSDPFHIALITLAAALWFVKPESYGRSIAAGVLVGLATLTRPYSVFLACAFAAIWLARGVFRRTWRQLAILVLVSWLPLGVWMARNYYWFGSPIVTSMTMGFHFWQVSYEMENGRFNDLDEFGPDGLFARLEKAGVTDRYRYDDSQRLLAIGLERIRQSPALYLRSSLVNGLRLWIPQGNGTSVATKNILRVWYGSMLALMVAGVWIVCRRRDSPVLLGAVGIVLYYTVFFAPLHTESRYTLPARVAAMLLTAVAIAALARRVGGMLTLNRTSAN